MEENHNIFKIIDRNGNVLEQNFDFELNQDVLYPNIFYFENKIYLEEIQKTNDCSIVVYRDITSLKDLVLAAEIDKLTGFYNKNHLMAKLTSLVNKKINFSIIFGDIDNFKKINSTRGRFNADKVLKRIGEIFLNEFKKPELVFRFGGDEMFILTREQDLPLLKERCQNINNGIIQDCEASCSFGIAHYNYELSIEENLNKLDMMLSESKENGKNLITIEGE